MENNLPAFPLVVPEGDWHRPGLTKRELIAAMALQGLLANPASGNDVNAILCCVNDAVRSADFLLLELSKPQP